MLSFLAGSFAVAGAIAAVGPVIIHLFNRRRYRTISWAAMEFLREAIDRNRRVLQLRDVALLILRTACLLLFGLAMARPYFSTAAGTHLAHQPVHAVLVIDNSLSAAYERLDGTLLEEAKTRALDFIERLPQGSRVSIVPLCDSDLVLSQEPYRTAIEARDALVRLKPVDRAGTAVQAAERALEACRQAPDVPAKRVVLFGDQQQSMWPGSTAVDAFRELSELQIVQVAAEQAENAWVSDLRLQDEVADIESPAVFLVKVRFEGPASRSNVEVALSLDGARIASQTVDLEPGQTRELRFVHKFDIPVEPGRVSFVPASVSLSPDRLPADDARHLAVPVVAALPVVFVDQYGSEGEDPRRNRYGESFHLRRLLVPVTSRDEVTRQLISIRHLRIEQLSAQQLQDSPLVVIAGIESPGTATPLLREYVEQGGQLIIAAGGDFDPDRWTAAGWLDGQGVLPVPLQSAPVGWLPDEVQTRLEPFFLAPETMVHDWFYIDESSREELAELYRTPMFFKAVVPDVSESVLAALDQHDRDQIESSRQSAAEEAPHEWLAWRPELAGTGTPESPAAIAVAQRPRVLAAFSNQVPFLVERRIGAGHVLLISSGLHSSWNNLARTNAMLLCDRILRGMIYRSLPRRTFATVEPVTLPVPSADRRIQFTLERPSGTRDALTVDALGANAFGVRLPLANERGHYRITAAREPVLRSGPALAAVSETGATLRWSLALNGPPEESELKSIDEPALRARMPGVTLRWIGRGETISIEGASVRGEDLWKWLMGLALAGLLAELAILGRMQRNPPVAAAGGANA